MRTIAVFRKGGGRGCMEVRVWVVFAVCDCVVSLFASLLV